MARSLPRGLTHHYHITLLTEARNTFGSDSNCAKWTLSPAGDVTHARKNNKGCIYLCKANNSPPPPPSVPPTEGVGFPSAFFLHVHIHKQKHTQHTDQNTSTRTRAHVCAHAHTRTRAHVQIGILGAPLWKGAIISQLTEPTTVWPDQKKGCVCLLCGDFFGWAEKG